MGLIALGGYVCFSLYLLSLHEPLSTFAWTKCVPAFYTALLPRELEGETKSKNRSSNGIIDFGFAVQSPCPTKSIAVYKGRGGK